MPAAKSMPGFFKGYGLSITRPQNKKSIPGYRNNRIDGHQSPWPGTGAKTRRKIIEGDVRILFTGREGGYK
jgi:hypothetical protein